MRKNIVILLLIFIGIHFDSKSQCNYEYKEKDVITGKTTFKTKDFPLSSGESKKQTYIVKDIKARFENSGVDQSLLIEFTVRNSYGKLIIYTSTVDSLIMRFEDGTTHSIAINKAPGLSGTGFIKVKLSYKLDETVKEAFKSGEIVAAARITGSSFNIDISAMETPLAQKFNECWIE